VGILSAALKKGRLSATGYEQMMAITTQLNTPGLGLAELTGVHAMTDVTGFGLAGHLLEICRGSKLGAALDFEDLPVLEEALSWVKQDIATGASGRNWASYGHDVVCPGGFPHWQRNLISDPQTSGGLLVACAAEVADDVLRLFQSEGFTHAGKIGVMTRGDAVVTIC
jgi:selenide,water dikinase